MKIQVKMTRNILGKPVCKIRIKANEWSKEKEVKTLHMGEKMEMVTGIKARDFNPGGIQIKNPPIYVTGDTLQFSYDLLE